MAKKLISYNDAASAGSRLPTDVKTEITTFAAPLGSLAKPSGDTRAGVLDWLNDSATGFLMHLRTGVNTTSAAATVGIGTDRGNGNGLLVSHKNAGAGISINQCPASGPGINIGARSINEPIRVISQKRVGPVLLQVSTGEAFADGVTTAGSPNLDSATANFTASDVGKTVAQLTSRDSADPFGCIPDGTTILSLTSATRVVMSANAAATGSAVMFNVAGRVAPSTQALLEIKDEVGATTAKFMRSGAEFTAKDPARPSVKVTGAASQSTDILQVLVNGNPYPALAVGYNGGTTLLFGTYMNNAGAGGAPAAVVTTTSGSNGLNLARSAAAEGNLLSAVADGSTPLTRINYNGFLMTRKSAAPFDAELLAGEMAFWLDTTNGAAKLMVKAKEAGGTVRTGSVALA